MCYNSADVWLRGNDLMRRFAVVFPLLIVVLAVLTIVIWPGWDSLPSLGASNQPAIQTRSALSQPGAVGTPVPVVIPGPRSNPVSIKPEKVTDAAPPWVNAAQVVVVDEDSGEVLYGRNEHERTPMASVTKIAAAIVALERGNLHDIVRIKYDPNELYDSTAMGCNPGEWYTLEDLLYGLMLPSGNDAALAIANHIAGSKEAFVQMMNDKVRELGLENTHFTNPHGLDEPNHYSSAYDMAMLARYGMKNPTFRKVAAAKIWDVYGSKSYRIFNLNRLLWEYEGADGVKIGFTERAGRTTVASATRNSHRVYVAFMHGEDIVKDVVPLFNYVFKNYRWRDVNRGALSE